MNHLDAVSFQIEIGGEYRPVDIDQETNFSFNLQASDLSNPTVTKIPFSAQINLPRTSRNNNLFSNIWKADWKKINYSPLERTSFRLYINNNLYESGYVKLEEVTAQAYKIRLYGGLGDYFYAMSEIRLKNLDFGDMFTHTVDRNFIRDCWSGMPYYTTKEAGSRQMNDYFGYIMAYQGQYDSFDSNYYVNGMLGEDELEDTGEDDEGNGRLNTHGQALWYNPTAAKAYSSPELNEHRRTGYIGGRWFFGEYRSYYQKPVVRLSTLFEKIVDNIGGWKTTLDPTFFSQYNPYWHNVWVICPGYNMEAGQLTTTVELDYKPGGEEYDLVFGENPNIDASLEKKIDIEFDTEEVDEAGQPVAAAYNFVVKIPLRIYAVWDSGMSDHRIEKRNSLSVSATLWVGEESIPLFYNGSERLITLDSSNLTNKKPANFNDRGKPYFGYQLQEGNGAGYRESEQDAASTFLFVGTKKIDSTDLKGVSEVKVEFTLKGDTYWRRNAGTKMHRSYGVGLKFDGGTLSLGKSAGSGVRSESTVKYSDIIRSDDTAFDFVHSYCKLFGLYYVKDKYTNTVTITTRNSFYGGLEKLDWTAKIDNSREKKLYPIPFDYRTGIMAYPGQGTKYEEEYKSKTSKQYGSLQFDTGYQFSDDEKDLLGDIIFKNCVIATGFSQYYIGRDDTVYKDNKTLPFFADSSDSKVDTGYSLAFRDGFSEVNESRPFIITDDNDTMYNYGYCWTEKDAEFCTRYPNIVRTISVAGGTYSLNFGTPSTVYNETEYKGDDTREGEDSIYRRFWREYLKDRLHENTRKLVCYINLTIEDIHTELFNKFIYIENTVWVLSKIVNFDPISKSSTKVELISVNDTGNYVAQRFIEGNLILEYNGAVIYNYMDGPNVNPVPVRTDHKAKTLTVDVQCGLTWKIDGFGKDDGNSIYVSPASGNNTKLYITVPATTTADSYYIPVRWGSTRTILNIIQVPRWTVTAVTANGKVTINGLPSPVEIEDGNSAGFEVLPDSGYDLAYWIIDGRYYYDNPVIIDEIHNHTAGEAVLYDMSRFVKLYCNDNNTAVAGETRFGNFWLPGIGSTYTFTNSRPDLSGYRFGDDDYFTSPSAAVQRQILPSDSRLYVYYDTLLANITIVNQASTAFGAQAICLLNPAGTPVENIPETVEPGVSMNYLLTYEASVYGIYTLSATEDPGLRISISEPEIDYRQGSPVPGILVSVTDIFWEHSLIKIGYEGDEFENTLHIPRGMEFRNVVCDDPYVTAMPVSGSETTAVFIRVGKNLDREEISIHVRASVYNGGEFLTEVEFTIVQGAFTEEM